MGVSGKPGVPSFEVLIIGILLFRVQIRVPYFRKPPYEDRHEMQRSLRDPASVSTFISPVLRREWGNGSL